MKNIESLDQFDFDDWDSDGLPKPSEQNMQVLVGKINELVYEINDLKEEIKQLTK
jgi:hypothetical protein